MDFQQRKIIELSNEILDTLLKYKKDHPSFTFSLRQRDFAKENSVKRLENGQWFQGSDYIYVPLFKKGDNARKVKTIGFVVTFDKEGEITNNYIEISCKSDPETNQEADFYKKVASFINLKLNSVYCGTKPFDNKFEILENLKFYITDFRNHVLLLLEKLDNKNKFIITDKEFKKTLDKINSIKKNLSKSIEIKEINQNKEQQEMNPNNKSSLNQILYGPPGTGKTYNTINKAISIINPDFDLKKDRNLIKEEYEKLVLNNQISFTTFHQSMSYEDFIEGIKPIISDENEEILNYEIKDGLFKIACANAAYLCYKKYQKSKTKLEKYTFDDLHDAFIDNIEELIKMGEAPIYKTLTSKDVTVLEINKNNSIRARAKNSVAKKKPAPLTKENLEKLYDKFSSIEEIKSLKQVKETVEITPRITEFYAVFRGLKEFEKNKFKPDNDLLDENNEVDSFDIDEIIKKFNAGVYKNAIKEFGKNSEPVILIIDEINRGNVSQIFGELITLIEEDKRLGEDEALEVMLPYSKEKFGVPPNLYIVGTMNTADRSVEALDTALRRRFSFEEIQPNSSLIATEGKLKETQGIVDNINLPRVLETINNRIEILSNRDHKIGHSYFMKVTSLADLKTTFKKNIIPLLQEYFYNDHEKIGWVLGEGFFVPQKADKKTIFTDFFKQQKPEFEVTYQLADIDTIDIKKAMLQLLGDFKEEQKTQDIEN